MRIAIILVFFVDLLLTPPAAAETVYKYRRADGRVTYSNRLVPGLELIETFEYKFDAPAPASAPTGPSKSDVEGEARIRKQLDRLEAAWSEVQEATRALAAAEEKFRVGEEPQDVDRLGVASGNSSPGAGGVPAAGSPFTGAPASGRRGRASPEYLARMEALEAGVRNARARLDEALRKYNQLR